MKNAKRPKRSKRGACKGHTIVERSQTFLSGNAVTKEVRANSSAHLAKLTELLEEKLQDKDLALETAHALRVEDYKKLVKMLIEGGSFDVVEARVLENYRKRCGISDEDHQRALQAVEVSEQTLNVFSKAKKSSTSPYSHYSLARGAMQYLGGESAKKVLSVLQVCESTEVESLEGEKELTVRSIVYF